MSGQINIRTRETLFSFEVWIEYIRLENQHTQVSDELALALRLLDFPTLIIYQPEKSGGTPPRPDEHLAGREEPGEQAGPPSLKSEHAFRKGKSCLFKMSMDTLHGQLSNTPLYAMVLDVKGEIPKLVGTSLISLAQLVDKIRVDVNARGISTPSSHGQKGHVGVLNLMGDTIGLMSVKYKLLSLGTSLLPHILERRTQHHIIHERERVEMKVEQNTCFKQPLHCGQIKSSDLPGENLFISGLSSQMCDVTRDASACVATQTEPMPTYKANQPALVEPCPFEDNLNVFCPPHMFYNSSGEDTPTSQGVDEVKSVQSFTPEATEHCTPERASVMEHNTNGPKQEDPNGFIPNFPGESLRQLPLLNALLVELSQLTRQSVQQPLSIHPNLAWIYSSTHTEPLVGDSTNPTAPTKPLNTPRQMADFPRAACSTTRTERGSAKNNNTKNSNTSAGRKLKYGTTKTFQLRLKKIPPGQVRQRQCMGTLSLSQASKSSPDNKNHTGLIKHHRGKKAVNQTASLSENAETVIHSVAVGDSATREAGGLHMREDQSNHARGTFTAAIAGKGSQEHSLRSEADVAERDRSYRHGESTHTRLLSGGKTAEEMDHAGCGSRVCSPHSSHRSASSSSSSSSSRRGGAAGREEDQYADDFNSLDPSEGRSTEPLSSPESGRGLGPWEAPSESLGSSRGVEGFRGRDSSPPCDGPRWRVPALPGPVVARGSPQRSLRGTHIIRPRTQISALSVSSDDDENGDRAVYSSLAAARSRKQTRRTSGADRSSLTESLRSSSRGRRSDSARNSGPAGGLSADSGTSHDSCEVEELRDELGSLELKRNYQHISELVANKLPGYTL